MLVPEIAEVQSKRRRPVSSVPTGLPATTLSCDQRQHKVCFISLQMCNKLCMICSHDLKVV